MAQTGLATVALVIFAMASPGWAAPSNPALMATPPQPKWSDLSVPQKIVLAPLSDDWDAMENYRQKKWLSIVARFSDLAPEEQRRVQVQMQSWDKLSPEERRTARENFKTASKLPSEKKQQLKQMWEEYSSLPESEKEKLKQLAESQALTKQGRPAAALAPLNTTNSTPQPSSSSENSSGESAAKQ